MKIVSCLKPPLLKNAKRPFFPVKLHFGRRKSAIKCLQVKTVSEKVIRPMLLPYTTISIYTVRQKKTAPLYFCNNFVLSFSIRIIMEHLYPHKFGTKRHHNQYSPLKCVLSYCLVKCSTCTRVMSNVGFVT